MNNKDELGKVIKRQRLAIPMTLRELTTISGISSSHLGRIERGERFPSARVLRKIARPLELEERELFTLAGYLSPPPTSLAEESPSYTGSRVDPYVARVLAQETVEVQRAVIGIISILKSIARSMPKE